MNRITLNTITKRIIVLLVIILAASAPMKAQELDDFQYDGSTEYPQKPIVNKMEANGYYSNHWGDWYYNLYRHGGLFKMQVPNAAATIMQNKVDIAEELGIPGLTMQEGFLKGLLSAPYTAISNPAIGELDERLPDENLLVYTLADSPLGKKLMSLSGEVNAWRKQLSSHQFGSLDYSPVEAFIMENGDRKLFVVLASDQGELNAVGELLENTKKLLTTYDLHRGWMGVKTSYKSIDMNYAHPIDLIGKGMSEGNSWFVLSGYNDYRAKGELSTWMNEIGNPVYVDVGSTTLSYISGATCFLYGLDDYEGLQEQNISLEDYLQFVKEKNGHIFRQVFDTVADRHQFDGYVGVEGNKEQIDNEEVPFVSTTGQLIDGAASSMVLFIEKGNPLTRQNLMAAILNRKAVAVLPEGKMMGPELYRNALQLLLLDSKYMEAYFGDRIDLEAAVDGDELLLTVRNFEDQSVKGKFNITLSSGLMMNDEQTQDLNLPAGGEVTKRFKIEVSKDAMSKVKPIKIDFEWRDNKKSTITVMELPPVVSVHQLLYGQAPSVRYPVSVHNFTEQSSFPVKVIVTAKDDPGNIVFEKEQSCTTPSGTYRELFFDLEVPAGDYYVTAVALGAEAHTQLGVENGVGAPTVSAVDLNGDGVMEYRMENDSVVVTLLATGARVIEYIVKSKNDNVFFKLWPDTPVDDRSPFRKRRFYPFGGFEDFLGGASIESHKVYEAEILKSGGASVSVKMKAEYFGNTLEKIFTLYGNTPLLEVKYTLDFVSPEANMIGPQPILVLGKEHGPEDVYYVPDKKGLQKRIMTKETYYGSLFDVAEGWNAGVDTIAHISFAGAFPVDQPDFLHMYMNHTKNPASHYNYVEFQPWIHIIRNTKMYFSYYMWATADKWEKGVQALRERNLITTSQK